MKGLYAIAVAVFVSGAIAADASPVCRLFDGNIDIDCPYEPNDVAKRINYFCGDNPRQQFRKASGDCRRDGFAYSLKQFALRGTPAVKWKIKGRKSLTTLATGCYCIIDE